MTVIQVKVYSVHQVEHNLTINVMLTMISKLSAEVLSYPVQSMMLLTLASLLAIKYRTMIDTPLKMSRIY